MSDPDSALPPEQDEHVRRLLAEARHDQPMPPEVVARLDRVLDDLSTPPRAGATVTPIDRRRRRAAGLLVAAAAVVAVGVGVSQVQPLSGGGEPQSAADKTAERPVDGAAHGDADGPRSKHSDNGPAEAAEPETADDLDTEPVRVRKRHFERDAQLVQDFAAADRGATLGQGGSLRADCRRADWGEGTFVPARYGPDAAVLVLRRPTGDTQVADLFLCGQGEPVRSARLPAP